MWPHKKSAVNITILLVLGILAIIAFVAAYTFVSQTTESEKSAAESFTNESDIIKLQNKIDVPALGYLAVTEVLDRDTCDNGNGYTQRSGNQNCLNNNPKPFSTDLIDCCCCDVESHFFFFDKAQANRFVKIEMDPVNDSLAENIELGQIKYFQPGVRGEPTSALEPYLPSTIATSVNTACSVDERQEGKFVMCITYISEEFQFIEISPRISGTGALVDIKDITVDILAPQSLRAVARDNYIEGCEKSFDVASSDVFQRGKGYYVYWDGDTTQWTYTVTI